MAEKTKAEQLKEELFLKKKNGILKVEEKTIIDAEEYCVGYKAYLDTCKTEREAAKESIKMAEKAGFKEFEYGKEYKAGDKVYFNNRSYASGIERTDKCA